MGQAAGDGGSLFHTVVVTRDGTAASVRVDDVVVATTGVSLPCELDSAGTVYLGGRPAADTREPSGHTPLAGCIREVWLDGRPFARGDLASSVAVAPCSVTDCPRLSALPGSEAHDALAASKRLADAQATAAAQASEYARLRALVLAASGAAVTARGRAEAAAAALEADALLAAVAGNAALLADLQALGAAAGTATDSLRPAAVALLQRAATAVDTAAATARRAREMHDEWAPATALALAAEAAAEQALSSATSALAEAQGRLTLTQQVQAAAAAVTAEAAAAHTTLAERVTRTERDLAAGAAAIAALAMPVTAAAFQARIDELDRQLADSSDTSLEVLAAGRDSEARAAAILALAQPLAAAVEAPLAAFNAPEAGLGSTRATLGVLQSGTAASVRNGAVLDAQVDDLQGRLAAAFSQHGTTSTAVQAAAAAAAQAGVLTNAATGHAAAASAAAQQAADCQIRAVDDTNAADTSATNVGATFDGEVARFNAVVAALAGRKTSVAAARDRAGALLVALSALRGELAAEEQGCTLLEGRVDTVADRLAGLSAECLLPEGQP